MMSGGLGGAGSYEEMQPRLRAMDEENTRLRNSVMSSNDEIFTLKAVAASVEAELKYSTDQELAKMGTELKFRNKELETLSKEHERALKELRNLKQAQPLQKKMSQSDPPVSTKNREVTGPGHDTSDAMDVVEFPTLTGSATVTKAPVPARPVSPRAPAAAPTELYRRPVPLSVFTSSAAATELSAHVQRFLSVLAQSGMVLTGELQEQLNSATGSTPSWHSQNPGGMETDFFLQFLAFLEEFFVVYCNPGESSRQVAPGVLRVLSGGMEVLHAAAPYGRWTGRARDEGGGGKGRDGPGAVVGNLQGKFDRAAQSSAGATGAAPAGPGSRREDRMGSDLVLCALKTPALTSAQRQSIWAVAPQIMLGDGASLDAVDRFAALTARVLKICAVVSLRVPEGGALLLGTARAGSALFRTRRVQGEQTVLAVCRCLGELLVGHGSDGAAVSKGIWSCEREVLGLWEALSLSSARNFAAFLEVERACTASVAVEASEAEGGGGRGVLDGWVQRVAAPLCGLCVEDLTIRCEVMRAFLSVLDVRGGEFVRLLLGVAGTAERAGEGASAEKKRHRQHSAALTATVSVSSSSGGFGGCMESGKPSGSVGAQPVITPMPPRKVSKAGRLDSIGGAGVGVGAGGGGAGGDSGAAGGARITPSGLGSGARSARRSTPLGAALDLQDQLPLLRRERVTALAQAWMRSIRYLDNRRSVEAVSRYEQTLVRLVHLLGAFLSALLDHLRPQDCEVVLSDAADVLHEYIYRCNTLSWSPLLKMPDSLFAFLESRQNESGH